MGYWGWLKVLLMSIALNLLIGEELLLVVLRSVVLLSALKTDFCVDCCCIRSCEMIVVEFVLIVFHRP
jgi:hypothetical protein